MKSLALAAALLALSGSSLACSLYTGVEQFQVDQNGFKRKSIGGFIATLPAPEVKVTRVSRGTDSDGFSCNDAGSIDIRLTWPRSSAYDLKEVGFYFRIVSGEPPDMIFPLSPVTGIVKGNKAEFSFVWLDGAPSQQKPLDLEVEVFAVNRGQEIGKSARFHVAANGG